MGKTFGKYELHREPLRKGRFLVLPLALFLVEVFSFCFLAGAGDRSFWPLMFGFLWSVILGALLRILPYCAARICYGFLYFAAVIYAGFQTGYYLLFEQMLWLSEFRYAAEGADYADVLLSYPAGWYGGLLFLIALGGVTLYRFPRWQPSFPGRLGCLLLAIAAAAGCTVLPQATFLGDKDIRYAGSDYGRMQSAEAVYNNMFHAHRLYQLCGIYQTAAKDVGRNYLYPLTPWHAAQLSQQKQQIDDWYDVRQMSGKNEMTGLLAGKDVILVLMESMDDWMIGEHTPTIRGMMDEGISFTNFYTPGYGGIRTFNTEFCINTGSFLSSQGGYAFDYVTNTYNQSLASVLEGEGYSAKTFHYNDPTFYSRGVFSEALGYEEYVCYADFLSGTEKEIKDALYDDLLLLRNPQLREVFFREGKNLNFLITRSAHLSYKYNEVLSHWGLKKYPQYQGLTGNEETDCALLKARLVDDLFSELLKALEEEGRLENTVIIGVTDHYTYGYKNEEALYQLSGVTEPLLLEKTPCFIWSVDLMGMSVDKVLNTADLLPTVLNLLGVDSPYRYMGSDAFDPDYEGWAPFSDGSWIYGNTVWDAGEKTIYGIDTSKPQVQEQTRKILSQQVQEWILINNLILETDYYQ